MTRSICRVQIRVVAWPTATHPRGRDEALEAGHDPARDPVGPLGHVPRQAEPVIRVELVSGDAELVRRQVRKGTRRHETGSGLGFNFGRGLWHCTRTMPGRRTKRPPHWQSGRLRPLCPGSGLGATDALGRADGPAEPRAEAEQRLTHGQGLPRCGTPSVIGLPAGSPAAPASAHRPCHSKPRQGAASGRTR